MKQNFDEIALHTKGRGLYDITSRIIDWVNKQEIQDGLLTLLIQHTSASLTINENADPTVRMDMESHFNKFVPERQPYYLHDYEGDDDMPAHIKTSTLGCELSIPINNGRLQLGTWQGIYLGEHRDHGGSRRIVATLQGQV